MQHYQPMDQMAGFKVLGGSARSQAATMRLAAGQSTGGPDNRHADADQWLYVIEGAGRAMVEGESIELKAGDLLLIEAGEGHEISAGDQPLVTFNIYTPPEY